MLQKLIDLPEVESKIGFKKSYIFKAVKKGEFPEPVRLGRRKTLWVEREVDAWINDRIQERDSQ